MTLDNHRNIFMVLDNHRNIFMVLDNHQKSSKYIYGIR